MSALHGVLTAMVTPFDDSGRVDEGAARTLASHLIENGSHGVVVAGSTGEASTLTDPEQISLLRAIVDEVGGSATVVCGTGTNDTRHSVELTEEAVEAGADAVLVVTPYYNKPNEAGIRAHFEAVAAAAGQTPVIAYNIPARCVINMPPSLLAELAEIDNVVAVKQANNDEIGPIEGLDVLAGNDDVFLRCLEAGGVGGILVASQVAGPQMRALYDAATSGDPSARSARSGQALSDRAREIDAELRPVYEALSVTTNPIPVKAALQMLGLIPSGGLRLPLVEADEAQRATVRAMLESQGLLATA